MWPVHAPLNPGTRRGIIPVGAGCAGAGGARPGEGEPVTLAPLARGDTLADHLASLFGRARHQPVSVGEALDTASEKGFGLLLTLLALPTLIPVLPPGTAAILGAFIAFLGLQRFAGLHRPWVPAFVRRWLIPSRTAHFLLERGIPLLRRLEGRSRPRPASPDGPAAPRPGYELMSRVAALIAAAMGLIMATPLPFLNTLPALVGLLIGVGLVKTDPLFVAAGIGLGGALLAVLGGLLLLGGEFLV